MTTITKIWTLSQNVNNAKRKERKKRKMKKEKEKKVVDAFF